MFKYHPIAFLVAPADSDTIKDFTAEDIRKWTIQISHWIKQSQNETNPAGKADIVMKAALSGTKINGEMWPGVEKMSLKTRLKVLCGWDIEKGYGVSSSINTKKGRHAAGSVAKKARKNISKTEKALEELSMAEMVHKKDEIREILINQFPWLDNPFYDSKVNALAEAEAKLQSISESFLTSSDKDLELALKIREGLRKDINELMTLLSIHPSQLKDKVDESDRGDVGSLVNRWDEFGTIAKDYEAIDAIQELIQTIRQCNQIRIDGSPQLADYMLWHKTGCAGHNFKCQCGAVWELYNGFTIDELQQAAEQAYKKYGFGLKKKESDGHGETAKTSTTEL